MKPLGSVSVCRYFAAPAILNMEMGHLSLPESQKKACEKDVTAYLCIWSVKSITQFTRDFFKAMLLAKGQT